MPPVGPEKLARLRPSERRAQLQASNEHRYTSARFHYWKPRRETQVIDFKTIEGSRAIQLRVPKIHGGALVSLITKQPLNVEVFRCILPPGSQTTAEVHAPGERRSCRGPEVNSQIIMSGV